MRTDAGMTIVHGESRGFTNYCRLNEVYTASLLLIRANTYGCNKVMEALASSKMTESNF